MVYYECPFCFKRLPEMNSPCCGEIGRAMVCDLEQLRKDAFKLQEKHIGLLASGAYGLESRLERMFTKFLWEIDEAIRAEKKS
jgi:hypothetical protein